MTSRRRAFAGDDGPPAQRRLARIVVVAMGSEWRGDDGVGTRVATSFAGRLAVDSLADCRVVTQLADPLDLLSHWAGAELAVIVDATRSGLAPGTVSLIRLEQPVSRLAAESGIRIAPLLARSGDALHRARTVSGSRTCSAWHVRWIAPRAAS